MRPTRRSFVKTAATATPIAALLAGLPSGWTGTAYADDSPELKEMRFGMIALTDCASIVMAHELGYFKQFGINSVISKEASWAAIRDNLSSGSIQATHMLIGMPLASTMGLLGAPKKLLNEATIATAAGKQWYDLSASAKQRELAENRHANRARVFARAWGWRINARPLRQTAERNDLPWALTHHPSCAADWARPSS